MSLEERIAKLKTSLAEKHEAGVFKENPNGFTCAPYCNGDFLSMAFEAGADALAEVYQTLGELRAYRGLRSLGYSLPEYAEAAAEELEALLKQMEEKV